MVLYLVKLQHHSTQPFQYLHDNYGEGLMYIYTVLSLSLLLKLGSWYRKTVII